MVEELFTNCHKTRYSFRTRQVSPLFAMLLMAAPCHASPTTTKVTLTVNSRSTRPASSRLVSSVQAR